MASKATSKKAAKNKETREDTADKPTRLPRSAWPAVFKRTVREFKLTT
ncbi:MAG: hypothetical protein JO222_10465 [Frankiales bacterium]|nr:hypothetical protein [Frankiales bacterium]